MIETACTCDGLPAHSHIYQPKQDGNRITTVLDEFEVRIWVDWRAIARSFINDF